MEDEDISEFDEAISALAEEILEDAPEQVPHPLAAPPPPPPPPDLPRLAQLRQQEVLQSTQSMVYERKSELFSESIAY
ncbi:MAG: hypothetical protein ACJZ5A_03990 [Candidatus Thalassarchaeaceae archaeon]